MVVDGSTNPAVLYVAIGEDGGDGGNGVYRATLPTAGAPVFALKNAGWPVDTGSGNANAVGRIRLAAARGTDGNLTLTTGPRCRRLGSTGNMGDQERRHILEVADRLSTGKL